MTAGDRFGNLARAIYTNGWLAETARNLNVSERTIRYWLKGQKPIPAEAWARIKVLAAQRCYEINYAATFALC